MKIEKFEALVEELSEFIGDHDMSNHHYLYDDEIVDEFSQRGYKKKHILKALEDVR